MRTLFTALLLTASDLTGAADLIAIPSRPVGSIEVPIGAHPDFDVASDSARKTMHFTWRSGEILSYIASRDGGATWSPPVVIANSVRGGIRMAVDSKGILHLVYATRKDDMPRERIGARVWHRAWNGKQWTEPLEVLKVKPVEDTRFQVSAPRVAIDGNDHVHVIGWKLVHDDKEWKIRMRCAYARKPQGKPEFEPTEEFSLGRNQEGGGGTGDIVTDPVGDVHLFYVCYRPNRWSTTHFFRRKTGEWGEKVDVFRGTSTDFGMRAAVDRDGVIHIAGQVVSYQNPKPWLPVYWTYFNNRAKADDIQPVHQISDVWEYGTDLLVRPNGDVWVSRGHWQKDEPYPWMGRYMRLDAASGKWSEPVNLSPEGYRNADFKYNQVPRFTVYGGKVRIFYAEAPPNGPFRFLQRILE